MTIFVLFIVTQLFSSEASGLRWSDVKGSALYAPASDPNGEGLPLGYSNSIIAPNCVVEQLKSGIFCPGGEGVRGNHILPVSGDAFHQEISSKTHEIKYVSDMDGFFNFLIGAIDISNNTHSYYDVYASGITLNALSLPESIAGNNRTLTRGALICANGFNVTGANLPGCTEAAVTGGNALLQNPAVIAGAAALTAGIKGLSIVLLQLLLLTLLMTWSLCWMACTQNIFITSQILISWIQLRYLQNSTLT